MDRRNTTVGQVVLSVTPAYHRDEMRSMLGSLSSIGIMYLASVLERAGREAVVLDRQYEGGDLDMLAGEILAYQPSLVGFSLFDTTVDSTHHVVKALRSVYSGPIVVGGYTATFHAEEILRRWPEVDYVVLREGEEAILGLAELIEGKRDIESVPNLVYRNNGLIAFTPEARLADVTELPWPKRELPEQADATPLVTRRGCMSRCTFCAMVPFYDTRLGPTVRRRRASDVVDEIEYCVDRGSDVFTVYDDNFGLTSADEQIWAKEFVREMTKRSVRASLLVEMRVRDVVRGKELLADLCAAGVHHISLGMESLLPRQLKLYNKGYKAPEVYQALDIIQETPVEFQTNVIFWDPFIGLAEALEHLRLLDEVGIYDQLGAPNFPCYQGVLTPHKGTKIYDQMNAAGMLRQDPRAFYEYHFDFTEQDTRELHTTTYREFLSLAAVRKLPALWLNVPRLRMKGYTKEADALVNYGRALARAEFDFFRAFLEMSVQEPDAALRSRYLQQIDQERGVVFRELAGDYPAGVAALISSDRASYAVFG